MKQTLLLVVLLFSFFIGFGQCPPVINSNIIFSSQAEIDNFPINYPNCTMIPFPNGLVISGDDIVDLSPLSILTSISRQLIIRNNPQLTNLDGLDTIDFVDVPLTIENNSNLLNIQGLSNSSGGIGSFVLINNPSLISLQGLENMTVIGGAIIESNGTLVDLSGLEGLNEFTGGDIIIRNNTSLSSLQGLNNLQSSDTNIEIINNDNLLNLEGLNSLFAIEDIILIGNELISDFTGLDSLVRCDELIIRDNTNLTSLNGLGSLENLGSLEFENNPALESLDGLSNNITNEAPFLEGVSINISFNNSLSDISSLASLPLDLLSDLNNSIEISNNSNLSECSLVNFCALIDSGFSNLIFNANAIGCNSVEEVQENCSTCPIEGVILTSQAEVDAFAVNYPDCTELSGLTISGGDIVDLSPLLGITTISGGLSVVDNQLLTNLNGLDNIISLNDQSLISIINNPQLIAIDALSGMSNTDPLDITIRDNPLLASFVGLENITGTIFSFEINNNDSIVNFEGFSNIILTDDFTIFNNDNLTSFDGLINFTTTGSFTLFNNDSLISLTTLNDIEPLCGVTISGNELLEDIDGFLDIYNDLCEASITIIDNPNLATCDIDLICELLSIDVTATINGNAPNCNSVEEVQVACNPCPIIEDIILTTQVEVNDFALEFSDCDIIQGTLRISGDDIVDLSPLNMVTTVGNLEVIDNPLLQNLDGLALFSIGKTIPDSEPIFIISGNPSLMNLDGLSQLFEIEAKTFEISNNPLLTNLDVFSNVSIEIGNTDAILKIDNNVSLVSINGFDEIFSFSGDLTISNNPLLESLPSNLAIDVSDVVSIINNDSLLNLVGLNQLIDANQLTIEGNDALQDVTGLDNYSTGFGFTVTNNMNLSSLDGLNSFNSIIVLSIQDNPLLTDISSLQNLSEIAENFEIRNNDSLTNLNGLQNGNVFLGFTITDNDALIDISALSGLETPTQFIEITNNSSLSDCVNPLICINTSNPILIINNNAPDCNSVEEVEEQCILGVEEELLENNIRLYPNPTNRILNIELPSEVTLQTIEVFSVTGKKVMTTQDVAIDFSSLAKGMYFARIMTNKGVITKKIVKRV